MSGQRPHRICQKFTTKSDDGDKSRWNEIGVAFQGDKGMSLVFNARLLLAPGDAIMIFPPRDPEQTDRVNRHREPPEDNAGF